MAGTAGEDRQTNWANRTLWTADNLDVMRGMDTASADLIYLDPPFNSKKNYAAPIGSQAAGAAFQDTWSLDDVKREWVEDIETDNTATWSAITAAGFTNGESTQAYLTYMAVRLIEMRRILKPTGSIYLHCDSTMSHYLKIVMDAIFGSANCRTEIVWKRTTAHSDTKQGRKQHGRIHDVVLFYTKTDDWNWNPVYTEYDREYVENFYRFVEPDTERRYQKDNLTGAKPGGDTSYEWRVKRLVGEEWLADLCDEWRSPIPGWEYKGVPPYQGRYWAYSKEKMHGFALAGRLVYAQSGMPRYKRYLDEMPGVPLQDLWTDIRPIGAQAAERLGYPTQKPLPLLERIIKASSNPGDMVLDPFCGCATTCIAAEKLGRQWAGIDIESKAREIVVSRLEQQADEGALFKDGILPEIHHLTRPPKRTDTDAPQRSKNIKRVLFKRQAGRCAGKCGPQAEGRVLDLDLFEVDHIVPRSKSGADIDDNLQLLCPTCNRRKGSRTMAYLLGLTD